MKNKTSFSENSKILFLYLFLAWTMAVTQPLMSILGKQPVFLIAHEVRGWLFVGLTLAFNFLPPFLVWLMARILGFISSSLKEAFIRIIIAFLMFLIIVPMLNTLPLIYAFLLSVFLVVFSIVIFLKIEILRTFIQWFSIAAFVFIFTFLFIAPSKQLLPTIRNIEKTEKAAIDSPVFFVILDEFPLLALLKNNDEIDEVRFPTFAKLAKEATWYKNATAISSATELAIPAILSGIKPSLKKIRAGTYEQYPYNLFTLFSSTHKIHALENSTRMCPSEICQSVMTNPFQLLLEDAYITYLYIIYPKDTKHKLPPINNRWVGFLREVKNEKRRTYDFSERLSKFKNFYNSFKDYPKNTVHFLHILMPHAPWTILPNLDLYGFYESDGVPGELDKVKYATQYNHQWSNDEWATQLSWRRELLQIGGVDSLLAQMLDEIKQLDVYDDATIVIVADHGASFIPGLSRRYAHSDTITDIANIPLFIKYPQQKLGKIDERHASNVDIFPTLLDLYDIDANKQLEGISLIGNINRAKPAEMIQEKYALTLLPKNHQSEFQTHIDKKNALFNKTGWKGVYHPQGTDTFLNKNIDSLNIEKTIPNAIKLKNANLFKLVKKDSTYQPVYYRLTKLINEPNSTEILVSVNGVLASHCYFFVHAENDCAGLIDPEIYKRFLEQPLKLQFYFVKNYENGIYSVDELLDSNAINAEITSQNNTEFIKFDDKLSPIVNKGAPYGKVALSITDNDSNFRLAGWVGDTFSGKRAQKVLIFLDGKLLTIADTGVPKNYLFTLYGRKSLIDSGFQVTLPVEQYPNIQQHNIRIFASFNDNTYNELNYSSSRQHELFSAFNTKNNRVFPINAEAVLSGKLKLAGKKEPEKLSIIDAFSDDFNLISAGDWFPVSKNKRWIGKQVYVGLPLDKNVKNINLTIKAKPIIYPEVNNKQRMNLYLNGDLIDQIEFIKKGTKTLSIDTKYLSKDGSNLLKLEFPDAFPPEKYGKGLDTRYLSLYVYEFKIEAY